MLRRVMTAVAIATFASTGIMLGAAAPAAAKACPITYDCRTNYYASSDYEILVGGKWEYCGQWTDSWGERTPYFTRDQLPCDR